LKPGSKDCPGRGVRSEQIETRSWGKPWIIFLRLHHVEGGATGYTSSRRSRDLLLDRKEQLLK
jgi:hypothetical protein